MLFSGYYFKKILTNSEKSSTLLEFSMDTPTPKKSTDREYILLALQIIGDFGATIAIPVVVFVLIGQWLDEKYTRGPLFTILAFVLAALISGRLIYKKAKEYNVKYQEIEKNNKETK